jgi:myo-inositol 2-dehydrogenase / D-chiro-inositol 1-dehydrogenase
MRVGVVGCGRMGRERAKAAASFGVAALFLFDEDSARAQAFAVECPGARALQSSSELFGEKPDAIFICTPPFCKGPIENQAIGAGIAFFVEKPIGVRAEESRPIVEMLDQRNVLAAVGYMNRYRNSVGHARAVLESRNIIGITAHWVGRKYGVPWWAVRELSGGPFNEQATHGVDLFRYLAGEVEPVHAMARKSEGIETTVLALLRLRHGALASFLYSCEAKEKDIGVSVETSDGVLELRGWDLDLVRNTIDGSLPEAESKPIFEKETHAFLKAVATGDRNLVLADYRDAHQTQIAMDGIAQILRS